MREANCLLLVAAYLIGAPGCDRPPIEEDPEERGGGPGGGGGSGEEVPSGCGDVPEVDARTLETDERVGIVLAGMTLREKVDQMAGFEMGAELFATPDNPRANVRGFRFRDGPRGVRLEEGTATCFPVAVARGAAWDRDLERRVGAAMGAEVKGLGHNLLLAPTVNTLRHPGWGRSQETYGEDPFHLGAMGAAFTRGVQSHVPACVKHFAGNNIEDTRMTNNAVIDEQSLRENYLRQFRTVVREADVACVMSAYNKVNGQYCSENDHLLREVLKGEWGFDGFVVSDWFAAKSTVESAVAGLDVEMPWRSHYSRLESVVSGGQVPEEVIDEAVTRILRIKFKFGFALLDEPVEADPSVVESEAHVALAREAARKGMVLLKNAGGVLPLRRDEPMRLAVVGRWADRARLGDNGSSRVTPSYAVTPFQGLEDLAGEHVEVVTGDDASAAEGADVAVVVAALTQADEGEAWNGGGDREALTVSEAHEALVHEVAALVDRTIVVLEAGGPIVTEAWLDEVEGLVMAWYPGMEGGHALAELLFGDASFSGRLPQTWPKRLEDEPPFGNKQAETEYPYLHGYRHFADIEPRFPFGFGLGYTEFEYADLVVPCETVTAGGRLDLRVDVINRGDVAGAEVVQVYVGFPNTEVRRPSLELAGFERVELAPGERRTVTVPVSIRDLAYWDVQAGAWRVEAVEHVVHVGRNARDLPLSGRFSVAAEGRPADGEEGEGEGPAEGEGEGPAEGEGEGEGEAGTTTVTFRVDMAGVDVAGGVFLQSDFNGWCGRCEPLSDVDGDGIWSVAVRLSPGLYQYKLTTNGWDGLQEDVPRECDLLPNDEHHNRYVLVGEEDVFIPVHAFSRCPAEAGAPRFAVTFQVDMTGVETAAGVFLQGSFNDWCGRGSALADADGDGIWTTTLRLEPGSYEYKVTTNGWTGWVESVPPACGPPDDGSDSRWLTVAGQDVTLPVHAFERCPGEGEPPATVDVTFRVDMAGVDAAGGVFVQGRFNGWCGRCDPLSDDDVDEVWTAVVPMRPGAYEYRYTTDGWDGLKETVPAACDPDPEDEARNRLAEVGEEDLELPEHAWGRCPP